MSLEKIKLAPGSSCELKSVFSKERSMGWAEGHSELQEISESSTHKIRVLHQGSEGLVDLIDLSPPAIQAAVDEAQQIAKNTPADSHRSMATIQKSYPDSISTDSQLFKKGNQQHLDQLRDLEKKIGAVSSKIEKVVKLRLSESFENHVLENSNGLHLSKEFSGTSFMGEVLAVDGAHTEVAWDGVSVRFGESLNLESLATSLADHALRSLGGAPIPSAKMAVVFHPRVGTQMLSLLANAISAESVQRGRSFLKGFTDKMVASSLMTIIDDPLRSDGIMSAPFDDEGMPHQTIKIIDQGVLKDYFYDLRSASKDNRESNGHGLGGSPHATNFYIEKGTSSLDDLLNSHPHVFLVREVMGLHMADPISGEFSLGATGYLYEKGKYGKPVRGVTMAGQLNSLLKDVSAVASDLTWYGNYGAPSFLVPKLSIAGA